MLFTADMLYWATVYITDNSRQQFQSSSCWQPVLCNGINVKDVGSCSPAVSASALYSTADRQSRHPAAVWLAVC